MGIWFAIWYSVIDLSIVFTQSKYTIKGESFNTDNTHYQHLTTKQPFKLRTIFETFTFSYRVIRLARKHTHKKKVFSTFILIL